MKQDNRVTVYPTDEQSEQIEQIREFLNEHDSTQEISRSQVYRMLLSKSLDAAEAGELQIQTLDGLVNVAEALDDEQVDDDLDADGLVTDGGVDDERVSSEAAVARATDGDGTAYTVAAVDLASHPALDAVGFADGTRQYLVLTDGGDVLASGYDRHKIARETGERWLHDAFDRLNYTLDDE